jgi:hypothetical protein
MTVLPVGVMPRYLYSAGAIVVAFAVTIARPVGEGLADDDAYARQGMYWTPGCKEGGVYRWRSLDRWSECLKRWWPGRGATPFALLVSFIERASSDGLASLVESAVSSHVRWGSTM